MILYANGKIHLSESEKRETQMLKSLHDTGVRKLIFNKSKINMPMSFSAWTINEKNNAENKFVGIIQGNTAKLIYDVVWKQISEGIEVFDLTSILSWFVTGTEEKTAYEILKKKEEEGVTILQIERTSSDKPIIYACYSNGKAWELDPWETGIVYERLKNLFGKGYIMVSIDEVLQNLK